jgi:hypothetical protein
MRTVISASRRTDLIAFFPGWLAAVLDRGRAEVRGPRGRTRIVDLRPEAVHTIVLWSKNFSPLLEDRHGLGAILRRYGQLYFLFTVTGLGGTPVEPGAPSPAEALAQLPRLVGIAGDPRRVSLRFDPIFSWREGGAARSNLPFFGTAAAAAASVGIEDIRFSFAQRYARAARRAREHGLDLVNPPEGEKRETASRLAEIASGFGPRLHACSQSFLDGVPGVRRSSCIDGGLLAALHASGEPAAAAKDRGQRTDCGCTASIDIGSYEQACPHGCVYCYAQ